MGGTAIIDKIDTREEFAALKNQNRYGAGWDDYTSVLNNSNAAGLSPPAWKTMGSNGHYGLHFTAGESCFAPFHIKHDWKAGTSGFIHMHFLVDEALVSGETITWKLYYTGAKGHHQGQSLTGTRTTITLTYTADGTEVAGEHLIVECSDADAIDLLEVDSLFIVEIEMDAETIASGTAEIFGLMCDIHYQSDGKLTREKAPSFTKNGN